MPTATPTAPTTPTAAPTVPTIAPTTPTSQGLDPIALTLTKAIAYQENGGKTPDYTIASGDTGDRPDGSTGAVGGGAYQFLPQTWQAYAGQVLGNANAPMTPENQNKVAYTKVKQWLDQGYTPAQVASMWNAGPGAPNAYLNTNQAHGNTPQYVSNVQKYAEQLWNGQTPQAPQPKSVGGFLGNVVQSGAQFVGNLGNALLHPVQTVQTIGSLPVGALQELGGEQTANTANFDAVKQLYEQRYGSPQAVLNTIYTDPVGFLADLSTIAAGAGGALGLAAKGADVAGAADVANAARAAGETAGTIANATNPISPIVAGAKAVGSRLSVGGAPIAAQAAGFLTGSGADAAQQLYRAAAEGGPASDAALAALRGADTPDAIVNDAISAYTKIADDQSAKIIDQLEQLDNASESLDISPVFKELTTQLKKFGLLDDEGNPLIDPKTGKLDFSRSAIAFDKPAQADIQTIFDTLRTYGTRAGDRLPKQVHILKRAFDSLYSKNAESRAFVAAMRKSVRKTLSNVPGYDEMTKGYQNTINILDALKGTFSIGGTAKYDTIFKKLAASLRQNDAFKTEMLGKLSEAGGANLEARIAGLSFSPYFARGLRGGAIEAYSLFHVLQGMLTPQYIGAALATSPRIMGEFIMTLGASKAEATKFVQALQLLKQAMPAAAISNEIANQTTSTQ